MSARTYFEYLSEPKKEQVKIKVTSPATSAQGIVVVGLDGWDYSKYDKREPDRWGRTSRGKNIRISANSPMGFTWTEFDALVEQINLARKELEHRANA